MAVSTRIKNNAGLYFCLVKNGSSFVSDDLKSYEASNDAKDDSDLTFSEAASGSGVDWTFSGTAVASDDAVSLNSFLWDNAGSSVQVRVGRNGNVTPSVAKPHYVFTATIPAKPGFKGEAGTDGTGNEFDFELTGTSDVTKATV